MGELITNMRPLIILTLALLVSFAPLGMAETRYQNDFESAELGSVPEGLLVIAGDFTVREHNGNKVLELPGTPLDTFSVMFGPAAKENVGVSARILGTKKGRRFPTFEVALNSLGGYKLRVSPGKRQLELFRGDTVKEAVPLEWQSGKWTHLKLELTSAGEEKWLVQGKLWTEGEEEPSSPSISFEETEAPPSGRPFVSGSPYAGTPILYDDLKVWEISK